MSRIAVHLYHDSTVAVDVGGEIRNIELERVYSKRHYDWRREGDSLDEIANFARAESDDFEIGIVIGERDRSAEALFERLGVRATRRIPHHVAHAAAAFYQSPFEKSLIVSYDGGGNDGTFRAFLGCRRDGIRPLGATWDLNLGIPYRALAHPIADIRKPDDGRELSNAGKLMGLAAYGEVRPDWVEPLASFFRACSHSGAEPPQMYRWVVSHLSGLGDQLCVSLERDALTGRDALDLARTGQHVFETMFLERTIPLALEHRLPICLSGGCALNVLTNQRLAELVGAPVFVPPNPNDCGLAAGALLYASAPKDMVCLTYSGTPILDLETLASAREQYRAVAATPADVAALIAKGAVVAVMRGRSEHGPRALGHRSILCDPSVPDMKDRLNRSVKYREPFRPYAPVVRLQDAHKYFENAKNDLSFMSFNPTVRPAWRQALASAIHVDSTARAQTVTAKQEPWLFDVLSDFERLTGRAALLNTSFNSKGRPIVTRVADAIAMFASTDIDALVIEDWMFGKPASTDATGERGTA
jgi:carbamoyltransferase